MTGPDVPAEPGSPIDAGSHPTVPIGEPTGEPAEPLTEPAVAPGRMPQPSARAVLGQGLDLNVAASKDVRASALLIGLLFVAAAAPLIAIGVALARREGGFQWVAFFAQRTWPTYLAIDGGTAWLIVLAALTSLGCIAALSVDSQLLAVIVIASRATDRAFVLARALAVARQRFWRLVGATFLTGLILALPNWILEGVVAPGGTRTESQFVVLTLIGVVLSVPFAYVAAWIVLGSVGARQSIAQSWRLARMRLRLAILIAIVNIAFQTIAGFAVGAGIDLLARLGILFGLGGTTGSGQLVLLAVIVALAIASVGSLTMTISALTSAPQVVAFLGLTGIATGLDDLEDSDDGTSAPVAAPRVSRGAPLVSRPMQVALLAGGIAGSLVFLRLL